ncbi:MAG: lipoate--protein ligase family protein [Victivallales bacterium]|nr:lipoate--protein ligase family protein [Victivallales bacterium]
MSDTWFLMEDKARSPYMNMAIDELLLAEAPTYNTPLIRFYTWDRPSVSIGYVQKYSAAPEKGYTIVRRPTGGGVVFHDSDLTYTAVIPVNHPIYRLDRMESYHVFHRAVLRALDALGLPGCLAPDESGPVDRATMQCFTTPTRYDVLSQGKKYAGAAQRRGKTGILHQGSVSLKAASGNYQLLKEKLIKAFEEELNINFKNFVPDCRLYKMAEKLAMSKYSVGAWNIHKTWRA